jgi:hypothetical protein
MLPKRADTQVHPYGTRQLFSPVISSAQDRPG